TRHLSLEPESPPPGGAAFGCAAGADGQVVVDVDHALDVGQILGAALLVAVVDHATQGDLAVAHIDDDVAGVEPAVVRQPVAHLAPDLLVRVVAAAPVADVVAVVSGLVAVAPTAEPGARIVQPALPPRLVPVLAVQCGGVFAAPVPLVHLAAPHGRTALRVVVVVAAEVGLAEVVAPGASGLGPVSHAATAVEAVVAAVIGLSIILAQVAHVPTALAPSMAIPEFLARHGLLLWDVLRACSVEPPPCRLVPGGTCARIVVFLRAERAYMTDHHTARPKGRAPSFPERRNGRYPDAQGHRRLAGGQHLADLRAGGRLLRPAPAGSEGDRRRGSGARHPRRRPHRQRPAFPRGAGPGPERPELPDEAAEEPARRVAQAGEEGAALHPGVAPPGPAGRHRLVPAQPPGGAGQPDRPPARHHQGHHRPGAQPHSLERGQ